MTTKKSENIVTQELRPVVMLESGEYFGRVRIATGTFRVATGDIDSGDIIVLDRFNSVAVPISIVLWNDDLDSNGSPTLAFDLGILRTDQVIPSPAEAVGGDQDAFATASTALQAAQLGAGTELIVERGLSGEAAGVDRLQNEGIGRKLWELANDFTAVTGFPDAVNPSFNLDIAMTITTVAATPVAGRIGYRIMFVID